MAYKNDPRELTARFDSICPETGKPIRKGDICVYYPLSRKAYHINSKTASDWRSQSFADSCGMADANW